MNTMFEPTQPFDHPRLTRVSAFQRYLQEQERVHGASPASSRLSTLSPSLVQDLMRFEQGKAHSSVLDVAAASVRHQKALRVNLQVQDQVLPLTFFPLQRVVHCPLDPGEFEALELSEVQVLQVEPAALRPPGHEDRARVGELAHYTTLAPVLWTLALKGPRSELLPEIAGQAAYRVSASVNVAHLPARGLLAEAVKRLKQEAVTLRELAGWPNMNAERASRLLNALYLQAALMVSRTHPAATNEGLRR
jgi:hypothetical protein